ncbi:GGDEF domain-containing protein [Photobacterium lipolyticum]|nr:GGDEF domain-containing protein [Photobacterium lipolyticum]
MRNITPFNILRWLSVVMSVSMITTLLLSGFGLYHLYTDYILKHVEQEAVSISRAFLASNHTLLLPPSKKESHQPNIANIDPQKLDEAFHNYLLPFNVIKIKVFSMDGNIIYSSEPSLIGQIDRGNIQLNKALSGYIVSEMKSKDEMVDLENELRFDVDIVETYIPIYNSTGLIVGCFEMYQDITGFQGAVVRGVSLAVSVLIFIFLMVFLVAFKVVNITTKKLILAQNELQALASIDSLTSVYNRHHIFKQLKVESSRVFRDGGDLSIILFDLDFFKNINDCYGHQVGDEVLHEVAKQIQNNVREYDVVGRYGGEEFLVILPNTDKDSAVEVADRVRQSIENNIFESYKQILSITISAGVSVLISSETSIEQIIKRADDALYSAKLNGRNQVMVDSVEVVTEEMTSPVMGGITDFHTD